jgi:SAM-dependent methyltransferase
MPWDANAWNDWYSNQATPSRRDAIVSEVLGLPPGLTSNNLLPGDAACELIEALGLRAGDVLLDLACGRGGWGLELARRSGARLIGVDWSTTALALARLRASDLGMTALAEFRQGTLTASGLADESVDAVVCLDSVQFVRPPLGVVEEAIRVLRPGGRFVATTWEPIHRRDPSLHPALRDRHLQRDYIAAGFVGVAVLERDDWYAVEHRLWEHAAALPGDADDPARTALSDEARLVLRDFATMRRVMAAGRKPAGLERRGR